MILVLPLVAVPFHAIGIPVLGCDCVGDATLLACAFRVIRSIPDVNVLGDVKIRNVLHVLHCALMPDGQGDVRNYAVVYDVTYDASLLVVRLALVLDLRLLNP